MTSSMEGAVVPDIIDFSAGGPEREVVAVSADGPARPEGAVVAATTVDVVQASVVVPKRRNIVLPLSKSSIKWHQDHWTRLESGNRKCNYCTLVRI